MFEVGDEIRSFCLWEIQRSMGEEAIQGADEGIRVRVHDQAHRA